MQILTITSQGQLTIPKEIRDEYGITGSTKVTVEKLKEGILIKPKKNFWSLQGSLKSSIMLTDKQLREARNAFSSEWGRKGV